MVGREGVTSIARSWGVERLSVGQHGIDEVEIGEMDYGFEMGGMDFLTSAGAVLDLRALTLAFR